MITDVSLNSISPIVSWATNKNALNNTKDDRFTLCYAGEEDRRSIYSLRHEIYASELGQHQTNELRYLQDELDKYNVYLVIKRSNTVLGFVSITCPGSAKFSVDKYFDRSLVPYAFDEELFEIRLLTIVATYRNSWLALALMYAAKRFVESHGGRHCVAICRQDLLGMYIKAGLDPTGHIATSGKVNYVLCTSSIEQLNQSAVKLDAQLSAIKEKLNWELHFSFENETPCYHGGSFFKAIGEDLKHTEKRNEIINADVLDAWFLPSPKVLEAINKDLGWLLQTSPPTHNEGLIKAISDARGVSRACVLPGAGSSDLIFLGLQNLLNSNSTVLLLDPCYGEYKHVLDNVLHCSITCFTLYKNEGFNIDIEKLKSEAVKGYDMIILINPNSPTGVYLDTNILRDVLSQVPLHTLVWIDETYIEYAGADTSLEKYASASENIIVCKSMSKVYALSGARVAYLCAGSHIIKRLSAFAPPWSVSLPAQMAAITALEDNSYYVEKYRETHVLRVELAVGLKQLGFDPIIPGIANFLLCYLPAGKDNVTDFVENCKERGLYVRDVANMGAIGYGGVRIAVKDRVTNNKMLKIIEDVLS
jgi:histidinol-phosphate/aromatic aminotransferase/cobyric acid decarboxylase-like protein